MQWVQRWIAQLGLDLVWMGREVVFFVVAKVDQGGSSLVRKQWPWMEDEETGQ